MSQTVYFRFEAEVLSHLGDTKKVGKMLLHFAHLSMYAYFLYLLSFPTLEGVMYVLSLPQVTLSILRLSGAERNAPKVESIYHTTTKVVCHIAFYVQMIIPTTFKCECSAAPCNTEITIGIMAAAKAVALAKPKNAYNHMGNPGSRQQPQWQA